MEELILDPVCAVETSTSSIYHTVYGGAMIFFCCEACRERFIANPLEFIDIRVTKHDEPTRGLVLPKESVIEKSTSLIVSERSISKKFPKFWRLLRMRLISLIGPILISWREGRYAARTSRELLTLFRAISINHSELVGRELYKLLVIARTGCDFITANVTLDRAQESFATWPVRRDLTLCDVVRYLIVSEFDSLRDHEKWIHSDVQNAVVSHIPSNLCIYRRRE